MYLLQVVGFFVQQSDTVDKIYEIETKHHSKCC